MCEIQLLRDAVGYDIYNCLRRLKKFPRSGKERSSRYSKPMKPVEIPIIPALCLL